MTSTAARTLHRTAIVADTHNDLLSAVVARQPESWPAFVRERGLLRMVEAGHRIAHGTPDTVQLCRDGSRPTGADAVTLMNELGMLIDVSHFGAAGVEHVLELSCAQSSPRIPAPEPSSTTSSTSCRSPVLTHVGAGPDFVAQMQADITPGWSNGVDDQGLNTRLAVPGLEGPAGLPLVTDALLARGVEPDDVVKPLGRDVCRLFGVPATSFRSP
jgi:microsomal dipeptidase-like Zn-dependent dipeptidase